MSTQKYNVTGMTCAACQSHVEKAVRGVSGVSDVSVSLLTNSMLVTFDGNADDNAVSKAVSAVGYGASPVNKSSEKKGKSAADLEDTETPKLKKRLFASLLFLIPLMYVSMGVVMWNWYDPLGLRDNPLACAVYQLVLTAVVMVINQKFFVSGFRGLVKRSPNMDALVALGSSAAFLYSLWHVFKMTSTAMNGEFDMLRHHLHELYFESSATILSLITVGKTLEAHSKGKAANALKALMNLAPKTALVVRDGKEMTIAADDMKTDDIFIVRPGESIAADGVVVSGESAVDESALTGESIPVDKMKGSQVSAATINQSGSLTCRAVRVSGETALDKIIEMVENASATKAPIAKIADRVSGIFVPVVIGIAVITWIVWMLSGHEFGYSLARAISVLVISCPCALGLATPVAIMVGSGQAAKNGILFKTAASLESVGKTDIAVLDKTGTITEGKPVVTDIIPCTDVSENTLLECAYSLERKSEHPLAKAVTEKAEESGISAAETEEFSALPGNGVTGKLNGITAFGGSLKLMKEKRLLTAEYEIKGNELAEQGKTPLFFALDGKLLGIIAVADKVRADSRESVEQLKNMGIEVVMLTGDNSRTAKAVAEMSGIDHVISDVLPSDKDRVVSELSKYGKTAMIGDGINDAPALTRADMGVAIGTGADVAVDAADIVLMNSSLSDVCGAIRMSRQTLKNIHENLFWAFFYNCLGIPLASGLFIPLFNIELNPMFGAAAMSLSSFCVVTNALRLNLFNPKSDKKDKPKKKRVILPDEIFSSNNKSNQTEEKAMTKTVYLEGMMCQHCVSHVKKALEGIDGIVSADVSLEDKKAVMTLEGDVDESVIISAITDGGYEFVKFE
ncbi:MAG: heavy metal translocating P-type ATPase [Ruminococcus sp.]|nr:heavy metal translocating P-type ATPase [Ruminococcus sp.]